MTKDETKEVKYETKIATPSIEPESPIGEKRGKFRYSHHGRTYEFATRAAAQASWNALNGIKDEDGEV